MLASTPHFKIQTFEGPLDLLLRLIEEKKLPITEVSLAQVTEQFLAHLKTMGRIQPEILANFLVVAAKLLVIKSRALLPTLKPESDEEDSAADLTNQLILLKKYREAAKFLRYLENKRRQSFTREPFAGEQIIFFPDPNIKTAQLRQAAKKLAETLKELAKLPEKTVAEVVSISEKIEHLQKELSEKVEIALKDLLIKSNSKTEVIVTFLALLELIKQKILIVQQEELFADIIVRKNAAANYD